MEAGTATELAAMIEEAQPTVVLVSVEDDPQPVIAVLEAVDQSASNARVLVLSAARVRHGDDEATERGATEGKLQRTPTWRAKCRIMSSGITLKVRTLGCTPRFPPYRSTP